jgi:ABC-type dipeptide/oligopeptide/nickel transport system permease component
VTLLINLIAFPISYLIAVPTGVIASVRRGSWFDTVTGVLYLSLYSIPPVLAGVFAIGFLANNQYLGLFPVSVMHDTTADTMAFLPSTNDAGVYNLLFLPVGNYSMTAEVKGFKKSNTGPFGLQVNQTARVDFKLEVGETSQSVEVTTAAPV